MGRIVSVKVHPKARRNAVCEIDGNFTVWTTAAPDKGEANDAVRKLLSDYLGCAQGKVTLIRGATSRSKIFKLED